MIGKRTPPPFICQENRACSQTCATLTSQGATPKTREERKNKAQQSLKRGGVAGGGGGWREGWKRRASEEKNDCQEKLVDTEMGFRSHFGSGQDFYKHLK